MEEVYDRCNCKLTALHVLHMWAIILLPQEPNQVNLICIICINKVSYGFILYVLFSWHTVGQRIFAVAAELMRI